MESIEEWKQKIKAALEEGLAEWGLVALVLLVGLASFGLGRLSALEQVRPPVSITQAASAAGARGMAVGGLIVASRSGSAYYYPWCAGAAKILPQNQRWFASEAAARNAGYAPAKNCKGLGTQ